MAVGLAVGLAGCAAEQTTPEAQVRAVLGALAQAATQGDVGAFKSHVSERYDDDQGYDRRTLAAYLTFQMMRDRQRKVAVRVRSITLPDPDRAEVRLHVGLAGSGGARGLRAEVYKVEVDLAKEGDGQWRMVWARWRPAPATDLL